MQARRWKVGLLGAGFICDAHAKALARRADVDLLAVCDRARSRAEAIAQQYRIAHVAGSVDEMLDAGVEVVHILLPPDQHVAAARRVLEAGRHAFVEKPLGLAAAECGALAALARERGLRLGANHNFLFFPAYDRLRRDAAAGRLGALDQVSINWLYPLGLVQTGPFDNWILREPGNLFMEIGPHLVAFAMDLLGPLDELHASVSRPIDLPGGGRTYRRWRVHGLKDQVSVDLTLSVLPGPSERSVSVRGQSAVARCDVHRDLYYRDEPMAYGLVFDNFLTSANVVRQLAAGAGRSLVESVAGTLLKRPASNPYGGSIARSIGAFYDSLQGEPDARVDGEFGTRVIAECERIVRAVAFEPAASRKATVAAAAPRPPTVLVIGGTGFIGKHLVRALVARGLGVRVATRSAASARLALDGLPVDVVQGDLADASFVEAALDGIEVVYDLARAVGKRWEDYYTQDVLVTKNIAERALARGVRRFIYTGTIDSYYSADRRSVITSDTPLDRNPHRNLYARSKAACEALLMDLHRSRGLPLVVFRPGIVIGKGCAPAHWGVGMFLSDTRLKLWGDGRHPLPFVLVEDVADALVLALDRPGVEGQTFLLTDGPLLSGREYVEAVSVASGTPLHATPTPIWRFYLADLLKEAAKHLIRHPNRRIPSYRDWNSRTHRARYDSSKTCQALGWSPAGSREALVERGIVQAVREAMR